MTHPKKNVSFVSQPLKPQVHGLIQIPFSLNGNPIQNDEKSLLFASSLLVQKEKQICKIAKSHGRVIKGDAKRSSFKKMCKQLLSFFYSTKSKEGEGRLKGAKF